MTEIDKILTELLSPSPRRSNGSEQAATIDPANADIKDVCGDHEPSRAVLLQAAQIYPLVDPDSAVAPVRSIVMLTKYNGVTDWRVAALFEICQQDLLSFIAVLRLVQLGLESRTYIDNLLDGKTSFDKQSVVQAVRRRLKNFGKNPIPTAFRPDPV